MNENIKNLSFANGKEKLKIKRFCYKQEEEEKKVVKNFKKILQRIVL